MISWQDTRSPLSADGVYYDPRSEFSTLILAGERLSFRNSGDWWRGDTDDGPRCGRIAWAAGVPMFTLRSDFRRSKPYRWEAEQ